MKGDITMLSEWILAEKCTLYHVTKSIEVFHKLS